MLENCPSLGQIGMAERIALRREPIRLLGREFGSPDYSRFVRSGPVARVEMISSRAAWVLATGRDGSPCRVGQLPKLRVGRPARLQRRERQRPEGSELALWMPRASGQLPWYVRIAFRRGADRALASAYRRCLRIWPPCQRMRRGLPLPGYSTVVRHVSSFESSFLVHPLRRPTRDAMPFDGSNGREPLPTWPVRIR
jgi:hypothetical protein